MQNICAAVLVGPPAIRLYVLRTDPLRGAQCAHKHKVLQSSNCQILHNSYNPYHTEIMCRKLLPEAYRHLNFPTNPYSM